MLEDPELRERLLHLLAMIGKGLAQLDEDLRATAWSLRSPEASQQSLEGALRSTVATFEDQRGIRVQFDLAGPLPNVSETERATLVRVLAEALANVAQHSGAREVGVRLHSGRGRISLDIVDDGAGFDVVSTLDEAVRERRLGIVGMADRLRLIGGSFEVDSKPGGPTRLRIVLDQAATRSEAERRSGQG